MVRCWVADGDDVDYLEKFKVSRVIARNRFSIDLQHVQILAALRLRVAGPHSTQESLNLQAGRCSRASILSGAVEGIKEQKREKHQ